MTPYIVAYTLLGFGLGVLFAAFVYSRANKQRETESAWWQTRCASDPRFNMSGDAESVTAGARSAAEAIVVKSQRLAVSPPDDIDVNGGLR